MAGRAVRKAAVAEPKTMARNRPRQERSQARVAALLDAAESIVVEVGMSGLTMREVARRAKLPIASVYHYYPAASAIIRALADRNLDVLRAVLDERMRTHLTADPDIEMGKAFISLVIDDIVAFLLATPSIPAIWNGLRSNPELRALDIEDTYKNAKYLESYVAHLAPALGPEQIKAMSLVITEAVGSTVLLAVESSPQMRHSLIDALKMMVGAIFRP